jgi:hypothetical protein
MQLRRGADKSLAFPISHFHICSTTKKIFFFDGLKKLEQRIYECVEIKGVIYRVNIFFNPVACCFLHKAKDLSGPLVLVA